MENTQKYKYHCRPGYGSAELLIEVFNGAGDNSFGVDLFDAIGEIHPLGVGREDLWMNDEILYKIQSDCGPFTISKDVWNFAFIMAGNNRDCIRRIDELLQHDSRFEKCGVDFKKYQM